MAGKLHAIILGHKIQLFRSNAGSGGQKFARTEIEECPAQEIVIRPAH
jgi:hypothetical protein